MICFPIRWSRITSSVTGMRFRFSQPAHFVLGLPHKGRFHSFAHAGEYPEFPYFPSHLTGYTSSRPRNKDRKRVTCSSIEELLVTGGTVAVYKLGGSEMTSSWGETICSGGRPSRFFSRSFSSLNEAHSANVFWSWVWRSSGLVNAYLLTFLVLI